MRIKAQLNEIVSYSKGSQINGEDLISDGKYDYLNGGVAPSGKWDDYNVPAGTVTISEGGNSCGYVNYMQKPFWCGAHCYYLFDSSVDTKYLYYILKSQQKRLMSIRSGACMPNIKKSDLGNFEITYDNDEAEQLRIVKTLDCCDEILSARQQELQKLDELVKARFVELFGDYKINDKGFNYKKGSELFKFSSGKFLPEEKRLRNGVPVYGGNGIAWYTDECLVDYPTVIIGRVGAQCGNIHAVTTPVWITDNAIYIKEQKTNAYTLEFLTELMRMMDFYQYADFSGQPKITQKPLETLGYIMPPIELQNEYTTFVKQIDKSKLTFGKPWQFCTRKRHGYLYNFNKVSNSTYKM